MPCTIADFLVFQFILQCLLQLRLTSVVSLLASFLCSLHYPPRVCVVVLVSLCKICILLVHERISFILWSNRHICSCVAQGTR
jgi:hypothetical protein